MKLHWLKLTKPCTLDLSQVKDYAGQPLLFNQRSFRVRCVTDEGLGHELVQKYMRQEMLAEITKDGAPVLATAPPAAPTPKKAAPKKAAAPKPPPSTESARDDEKTVKVPAEAKPEPEPAPPAAEEPVSESAAEEPAERSSSSRRRKRSKK